MDMINKPITLLKEDFVNGLVNLCNSSGLPFFIIESVMKDVLDDVHMASKRQLEKDMADYSESLKKLQESQEVEVVQDDE